MASFFFLFFFFAGNSVTALTVVLFSLSFVGFFPVIRAGFSGPTIQLAASVFGFFIGDILTGLAVVSFADGATILAVSGFATVSGGINEFGPLCFDLNIGAE